MPTCPCPALKQIPFQGLAPPLLLDFSHFPLACRSIPCHCLPGTAWLYPPWRILARLLHCAPCSSLPTLSSITLFLLCLLDKLLPLALSLLHSGPALLPFPSGLALLARLNLSCLVHLFHGRGFPRRVFLPVHSCSANHRIFNFFTTPYYLQCRVKFLCLRLTITAVHTPGTFSTVLIRHQHSTTLPQELNIISPVEAPSLLVLLLVRHVSITHSTKVPIGIVVVPALGKRQSSQRMALSLIWHLVRHVCGW